jgi:5-methyltetrahydrofolate--homocysteine methyltransferase
MSRDLIHLFAEHQEDEVIRAVKELLEEGTDPADILEDARSAMQIVGGRFAAGEYFIPDLIYAGEILNGVVSLIKPKLEQASGSGDKGRVVIGSVAGDLHDIGKNLVVFMLETNGFEVFDLGVDVKPEVFVESVREEKAHILGLSGFLTSVYQAMKDTVDAVAAAGMRNRVRIMIGGGVMDERVREFCGADAYRPDAMSAVALADEWVVSGE